MPYDCRMIVSKYLPYPLTKYTCIHLPYPLPRFDNSNTYQILEVVPAVDDLEVFVLGQANVDLAQEFLLVLPMLVVQHHQHRSEWGEGRL